jgi:hypothetical protein
MGQYLVVQGIPRPLGLSEWIKAKSTVWPEKLVACHRHFEPTGSLSRAPAARRPIDSRSELIPFPQSFRDNLRVHAA